ncbi:hypothetical protein Syn7803US61_15 [Synechococcus phage ACG-2014d]|uniref:Uncharacterized protein n=1 Tax=Synechococcus phage ACG-2014d TaxID=1493509 RepID=A0A0E3FUP2_9CAUD|nr:hypothetical protein Syn7803US61_15 [Synechococcus phage ACG-2014d]
MLYWVRSRPISMEDIYLQHVFVNMSKRQVTLIDDEGYDETVTWKFDEEGAEGFYETLENFRSINNPDLFTYTYEVAS